MKILKVKIKRTTTSGRGTHYDYPPEYDASKIQVLRYESMAAAGVSDLTVRDNNDELCIGLVKDSDAADFLKSDDITEMTKEDSITLGSKWMKGDESKTFEEIINFNLL